MLWISSINKILVCAAKIIAQDIAKHSDEGAKTNHRRKNEDESNKWNQYEDMSK